MSSSHWIIDLKSYCQLHYSQCFKCLDIQSFEHRHSFLIFLFVLKCLDIQSFEHRRSFLRFLLFLFLLKCLHTESFEH